MNWQVCQRLQNQDLLHPLRYHSKDHMFQEVWRQIKSTCIPWKVRKWNQRCFDSTTCWYIVIGYSYGTEWLPSQEHTVTNRTRTDFWCHGRSSWRDLRWIPTTNKRKWWKSIAVIVSEISEFSFLVTCTTIYFEGHALTWFFLH